MYYYAAFQMNCIKRNTSYNAECWNAEVMWTNVKQRKQDAEEYAWYYIILKIHKIIQMVAVNVCIHNAILKSRWKGNENEEFKGVFSYISNILFLKK